ncbi:arsenate reductase (azurin) small subunit [Sulfitobacter pseudonitzschiae]|nr:arsenate reductase (azurin) small subunit [Pseudosulfitobacter pseudonitzschiae]MBM2294887.1 arsenate reductase (azurin) small subunit [Pseudosulfitobacter pseudonitzschiae]MBM2299803.1 arsenate reductase (azurin) small subunit [Pseudosulfitobacter pseudonitzschiae]MBM2304724.1 arsenate reductase (azurin) small subunit [Pseudosulfitobacter pseudonitzschiae]MBM2314497.1 arsenate reductase (azurin) small subunit [Pseudosulfitobacter pseudonitzschiae]MBM2319408.1 arsenate reductase (azurin) sm|tara:strand:- start:5097 stop:5618 length:522 start_codon:yes stop_codon:yes gene_type:complete
MKCNRLVDAGRRQFLRGGAMATAGAAVAAISPAQQAQASPALAQIDYPSNRLANVADLAVNEPMDIEYPDADSPGVLLKLGEPVEGGVGPDSDIVAYTVLCPHKGWYLNYNGEDRSFNCPGHFSRFDAEAGGQQIWGHATQNLPQFTLRVDNNGDIFAEGCSDLIFGRPSNVL